MAAQLAMGPPRQNKRVRTVLRSHLLRRGRQEGSEAASFVEEWLIWELAGNAPDNWETRLQEAVDLALQYYDDFNATFCGFFLEPNSEGSAHVRRSLVRRFGFAEARMIDGVLNRILDRRLHILERFCRKYQPSLFGPCGLQQHKLRGYFVRVTRIESFHPHPADLPWNGATQADFAALSGPTPTETPDEVFEPAVFLPARQLVSFWSAPNLFTPQQCREGLTSLGLGFLADEPELARRSKQFLVRRLPAWEADQVRLKQRVSRALALREDLEKHCSQGLGQQTHGLAQLAKVEERLEKLRRKLARHPLRLRPRPKDVQEMLRGLVVNAANVRFRRIDREIALFELRVCQGAQPLDSFLCDLPQLARQGAKDVLRHLSGKPASTGEHGLSEPERARRRQQIDQWLARGREVLAAVRELAYALRRDASITLQRRQAVLDWLTDVDILYQCGLLKRKGVAGGLGTYRGRQLERLLRCGA